MNKTFLDLFKHQYPREKAPFLHQQYETWVKTKPLQGLRVLHHVPVVQNTLLKVACLLGAGAQVVVTNPNFLSPCPKALEILQNEGVPFVEDLTTLKQEPFDIYFDCGADLYRALGAPRIGAIELTESGDELYRQMTLETPVISIDQSLTKQLETVFGVANSAAQAIEQLSKRPIKALSWLVVGFGKIGRGIAYHCLQSNISIQVIDTDCKALAAAENFHIPATDANDLAAVKEALDKADIIITATGSYDALRLYPKEWFAGKVLANMGVPDEFGERFTKEEVLNAKKPINFVMPDPTPIEFIDPELYAHNQVVLDFLNYALKPGVHSMKPELDFYIIDTWCAHHNVSKQEIDRWFITYPS